MLNDLLPNITAVYSGKPGCMCGCNGKYSYASAHVDYSSKDRGYAVTDDEVNDRSVKILAKKVLTNPNTQFEDGYAFLDEENRSRVVYFKE